MSARTTYGFVVTVLAAYVAVMTIIMLFYGHSNVYMNLEFEKVIIGEQQKSKSPVNYNATKIGKE